MNNKLLEGMIGLWFNWWLEIGLIWLGLEIDNRDTFWLVCTFGCEHMTQKEASCELEYVQLEQIQEAFVCILGNGFGWLLESDKLLFVDENWKERSLAILSRCSCSFINFSSSSTSRNKSSVNYGIIAKKEVVDTQSESSIMYINKKPTNSTKKYCQTKYFWKRGIFLFCRNWCGIEFY